MTAKKTDNPRMKAFKQSLHRRGLTIEKLANYCHVDRAHLCDVLAGKRKGKHTWPRFEQLLTIEEKQLLGRPVPENPAEPEAVEMFHVEQQNEYYSEEDREERPERRFKSLDALAGDFS